MLPLSFILPLFARLGDGSIALDKSGDVFSDGLVVGLGWLLLDWWRAAIKKMPTDSSKVH